MAYAAPVNRPCLIGNGKKLIADGYCIIMSGKIMISVKLLFCIIRVKLRIKLQQRIVEQTLQEIRCRKGIIAVELRGISRKITVECTIIGGFVCITGKCKDPEGRVVAEVRRYTGRYFKHIVRRHNAVFVHMRMRAKRKCNGAGITREYFKK